MTATEQLERFDRLAPVPTIVVLFGLYAVIDGVLALVATARGPLRVLDAWPVAVEGLASLVLGVLALVAPLRLSRELVITLALWGIVIGIVELVHAAGLPRTGAGHWLLLAAGLSAVFLAALLLTVPYADAAGVALVIGAYALVFGAVLFLAAFAVARSIRGPRV